MDTKVTCVTRREKTVLPSKISSGETKQYRRLLAGEVIHGYRIFEQGIIARHHGDSAVCDEVALPVGRGVVADARAFGDVYVAIDYGLADAAMPADIHVREQDTVVDFAIGVYSHIRREHAVLHRAPGNDAAGGDYGIERGSGAPRFGEDKLGRRILPLVGADGPLRVIQIE